MAIRVSPTEQNPTHDISLSDGLTTIGLHLCNGQGVRDRRAIRQASTPRTSLQIQSGDPSYSGFNLPYTPITQKDWSGGRGQAVYERDTTRYYDAYRVNTIHGPIFLGPKDFNTTSITDSTGGHPEGDAVGTWPTEAASQVIGRYLYDVAEPATISAIRFMLAISGPGGGTFTAVIYEDTGGIEGGPGSQLATSTRMYFGELPALTVVEFPIDFTFTPGQLYWIGFGYQSATYLGYPQFQYDANGSERILYFYGMNDAVGTVATGAELWFETASVTRASVTYFDYRGQRYAVRTKDDTSTITLLQNGPRGFAKANGSAKNTLQTDVDLSGYSVESLVGARVRIIAGPGVKERTPWRTITSHTTDATANVITVSPAWEVTHSAATEFIIVGSDEWETIAGHGLTGPITDVLPVGDFLYFAQGDSVVIRKARYSAGAWAWDDETAMATFMRLIPTATGTTKIWLAQASTSNVYNADPVTTWPNDLTTAQKNGSKPIGNPATKITGMVAYGNPRIPYFFKEDGFGSISDDVYAEIPNAELEAVADERNGRASCVAGVYLFFSMLDGFERYYDQSLDDIGPNRGEGLPVGRQGSIVAARPYPGGVYCAIDGGVNGYSSVMFWSSATNGWHEQYRAPHGKRISDIKIQTIPGLAYQKLWFNQEADLCWIPVAINPLKAPGYPFTDTGYCVSSWYRTGLGQIKKFWRDLQIFIEQVNENGLYIEAAYQVDEGDWQDIPGIFENDVAALGDANPKHLLAPGYSVTGERIRFRVTLHSDDHELTPRVIAITANAITRVPASKTWVLTFQADDTNIQEGDADSEALDMDGLFAQLETWADSETQPAPVIMRSTIERFDQKYVFIDNPNVQLREVELYDDVRDVKAIGNVALYEA